METVLNEWHWATGRTNEQGRYPTFDAPKYSRRNSGDLILLDCKNWSDEDQSYYEEANKEFRFFQTDALKEGRIHVADFPNAQKSKSPPKIGRNQVCPCGSCKKYKRRHGQNA